MSSEAYEQKRVDPSRQVVPPGDKCTVCNGIAMWMPCLSNVRFCAKCYPAPSDKCRPCETGDKLVAFDRGEIIYDKAPFKPSVTKDEKIDRKRILSGILNKKYNADTYKDYRQSYD